MGKIKITLEDLFNISGAVIYNPDSYKPLSHVFIDSRKVKNNSLFIAIKGDKFDGHDFVFDAVKKGAKTIIVDEKKISKFKKLSIPIITVKDTTKTYGELAKMWRKKLSAKVISITGSNGKTTTKEIVAALLSKDYKVVKTEANNNNHIGVPLTIFSANEKTEFLILEQGTNHFGEIEYTANISQPDYALITNIGESHIEFLKDREGVYKEKSALFNAAQINNGLILVNYDDSIIKKYSKKYKNKKTYGFNGTVDIKGKILGYTDDGKTKIQVKHKKDKFSITLPLYGLANAKNFLAACSIVLNAGLKSEEIVKVVEKIQSVHGRLEVKKYSNAIIIDDTYNSSPTSVESAVQLVNKIKIHKNKIFVLGDIFELGSQSADFHKELSKLFKPLKHTIVLTIGNKMKYLQRELLKKNVRSIHFHKRDALALYLQYEEIENSVILVKGSRGMKMEEFVHTLEKRFE